MRVFLLERLSKFDLLRLGKISIKEEKKNSGEIEFMIYRDLLLYFRIFFPEKKI